MNTTPTTDPEAIRSALATAQTELEEAQADVALLDRLKGAQDRVKRVTSEITALNRQLTKSEAEAAKAAREATRARIRDLEINRTGQGDGLHASYTITYKAQAWNGFSSEWCEHSAAGFSTLEPEVMAYILEFVPEKLPTFIADLAPGDPHGAMDRYLNGLQRGFLAS